MVPTETPTTKSIPKGKRLGDLNAVALMPFQESFVDMYLGILQSEEYRQYHSDAEQSRETILAKIKAGLFISSRERGMFIVVAGGIPVGWVQYHRPEEVYDAYELSIYIGEKMNRGKGIGTKSFALLIDYLFSNYDTVRLQARVLADNPRSLRLCRKLGFKEEGLLRSLFRMKDGTHMDVHMLSLLKSEWEVQKT